LRYDYYLAAPERKDSEKLVVATNISPCWGESALTNRDDHHQHFEIPISALFTESTV
jgi:hypothetical protein